MKITRTNADIDAIDGVLDNVFRFLSEQPSPWTVRVQWDEGVQVMDGFIERWSPVDGFILAETYEDGTPTGSRVGLSAHDVTELEIF